MNTREKWKKSTLSSGQNGCVEVSDRGAVRDSKNRTGPVLRFSNSGLRAFIVAVRAGRHDR